MFDRYHLMGYLTKAVNTVRKVKVISAGLPACSLCLMAPSIERELSLRAREASVAI